MHVFHGFPYSGAYPSTTWPGVTIFSFMFTDMWGPRQPVWKHMTDMMNYVARNQFVSQFGTPRVDVALYSSAVPWSLEDAYQSDNLRNAGFTYDYLGSSTLEADLGALRNQTLLPDGPGYKALVFYSDDVLISASAADTVKTLAYQGYPMVFIGETNPRSIGMDADTSRRVLSVLDDIFSQ